MKNEKCWYLLSVQGVDVVGQHIADGHGEQLLHHKNQ
jgi:hypothetical protein